jgi:hypothetical protein
MRVLEQGPDRQRAPTGCSGGVSSIDGASESRCNHDEPAQRCQQGQQPIRHRSSSAAMGVHEGGFMAPGQAPWAVWAFCQPVLAWRLQAGPPSTRVISATPPSAERHRTASGRRDRRRSARANWWSCRCWPWARVQASQLSGREPQDGAPAPEPCRGPTPCAQSGPRGPRAAAPQGWER